LEGVRGIEPPLRFSRGAIGFEVRGAPSTITPNKNTNKNNGLKNTGKAKKDIKNKEMEIIKVSQFSGQTPCLPNPGRAIGTLLM